MGISFLSIIPAVWFLAYLNKDDTTRGSILAFIQSHPFISVASFWVVFFVIARFCAHTARKTGVHVKTPEPYVAPSYTDHDNDTHTPTDPDDDIDIHPEMTLAAVLAFNKLMKETGIEELMMGASQEDFASFISELSADSASSEEDIIKMMHEAINGTIDDTLKYASFLFELNRFHEALPLIEKLAKKDIPDALYFLGCMYNDGSEVEKDYTAALNYFSKAADKGHLAAMNNLAWLYQNGHGVEKDLKKAFEILTQSATHDDPWALNELGRMYEEGIGITSDHTHAVACYTKAADMGYLPAFFSLGNAYRMGKGIQKNDTEAVKWFTILREDRHCRDASIIEAILDYENSLDDAIVEEGRERAYEWLEQKHSMLDADDLIVSEE